MLTLHKVLRIADEGVQAGVQRETNTGRTLACHQGCASCCRAHRDIPVYPVELVGISWYATEKVRGPGRAKLQRQLKEYSDADPCPFLIDELCAIHPVRPQACRHFNVFDKVCEEGEDAWHTRRQDVLQPDPEYQQGALETMLEFHNVTDADQRRELVSSGEIHKLARNLTELNWSSLSDKMTAFDAKP